MHIYLLYIISFAMLTAAVIKFNRRKAEWMLLLVILSFVQTSISMLFGTNDVFALMSIAGIQIHLKDIIMLLMLAYLVYCLFHKFKATEFTFSLLLLLVPFSICFVRGIAAHNFGTTTFFGDIRKYLAFMIAMMCIYFFMRKDYAYNSLPKFKEYIDNTMTIVLICTIFVWILDLGFGMRSLPGQIAGTLSDGGSTLRIIPSNNAILIAIYTLYVIYTDLMENNKLSVRALVFTGAVILLQWRSVVAAFLVGALFIFILSIKKKGLPQKLAIEIMALTLCVAAVAVLGVGDITAMVKNLFESFESIKKGTGTFSTRTEVWEMILGTLNGIEMYIGKPFGEKLNISWQHSAHSAYIDWASKTGYIGLVLFVAFIAYIFYKAIKQKSYFIMAVILTTVVYWCAYGVNIEQGVLIGAILAILEYNEFNVIKESNLNVEDSIHEI